MASRHYLPSPATLRPKLAANGLHLLDEHGYRIGILSPEQLLLLVFLRGGELGDPGEALGLPPDRRVFAGDGPRRSPAERAALSRSLTRLHHRGLVHRRFRRRRLVLTRLGVAYADWIVSLVFAAAGDQGAPVWVSAVAARSMPALRRAWAEHA